MGLQVLNDDGTPVTWSTSVLRKPFAVRGFSATAYGVGW